MISRRAFLGGTAAGLGVGILGANLPVWAQNTIAQALGAPRTLPLLPADDNGLHLPQGFTSRVIARSSKAVANSGYTWHGAPDGGAVFPQDDGSWIYVSNAELEDKQGGVSALRFDKDGHVIDAYSILEGTTRNCAGGATPWGTWLSCEEYEDGLVWECDPLGRKEARPLPALGRFTHEAAAFDVKNKTIYMTEDQPDGLFYRFRYEDETMEKGVLERLDGSVGPVLSLEGYDDLVWRTVDPEKANEERKWTDINHFNGGEGCAYHEGHIYFSTKGDNKIWDYDIEKQTVRTLYDLKTSTTPVLSGVDNVTMTPGGKVLVAEDGGNNELVMLNKDGYAVPILRLEGHDGSELTGPAFSPDGTRLYFSSQRGKTGKNEDGVTFEVSGPFSSL